MEKYSLDGLRTLLSEQMIYDPNQYDVFLFGAGRQTSAMMPYFQSTVRPKALCDNDANKWGGGGGLPVIPPEQIRALSDRPLALIMFLPGYDEIARQLDGLGVPYLNAFSYFYHREFWGIEAVYQRCLTDERSRDTFLTVLTSRALHNSKLLYPVVTEMIYFAPPQFRILSRASRTLFVDCGAYTGDTLEEFVRYHMNYFHKYVAFEPSPTTYAALGKRARRLMEENLIRPEQIALEHKGCGRSQAVGKLVDNPYERAGNRLTAEGPGPEVEIVSLDHYFSDPAVPVTCIKADIEGAELDMLRGAEGVIRRDRPNLAICLYHCPGDLYEIPLLLKEFVPEYRMAVGQHGFCFEDTVLYCWVER